MIEIDQDAFHYRGGNTFPSTDHFIVTEFTRTRQNDALSITTRTSNAEMISGPRSAGRGLLRFTDAFHWCVGDFRFEDQIERQCR